MKFIKRMLSALIAIVIIFAFVGCESGKSGEQSGAGGYDGRVFDVSALEDGSLTVTSTKEGNNYTLTMRGTGDAIDYNDRKLVPWNILTSKVTSIEIEDGVKSVGDYYFYSVNVEKVFLPSSIMTIQKNSFSPSTVIYSYSTAELNTTNQVYYYSSAAPAVKGDFFYEEDGEVRIWPSLHDNVTYSVLFIGNSFTFRQGTPENPMVPYLFKQISEDLGQKVNIDFVVQSSYTLTKYANQSDDLGKVVAQKLNESQYDFIVLQEQSTTPLNSYNAFNKAVGDLKAKIEKSQKNAKIYLYHTWGSPAGIEGTSYKTVAAMTAALKTAYDNCAKEYELPVTYVGNAITYVYDNYKDIAIYADDNRHQSNLGAYLSACCHVASMFNLDVRNCTFCYTFEESVCKTLQQVAYQTIFN